jgi:c(7)-type cytochrome triheme protein
MSSMTAATDNLRVLHRRLIVAVLVALCNTAQAGQWQPLKEDGLHDTTNPSLEVLQNPADALSRLPADSAGNKVDWARAIRDGYIAPRSRLREDKPVRILESSILMNATGSLPRVRFPHETHTRWLDCSNCHEQIFKSKAGETPVTMSAILEGNYCGVCHGAVAFPLTECNRCHTVPLDTANQGAQ